ncbi:MAG: hypothetical protein GYA17_11985 [Chloroflexi bacterium]|nr:hypothetical protein [Anaerolineaceae bacterium]NMB89071.1 hypothetical protein [Chloroflexota bacterium]
MTKISYTYPVAGLLSAGDPRQMDEWPEYPAEYGLSAADVPELVRMATDEAFDRVGLGSVEAWAPLHAWRALGQLGAAQAVPALTGLFERVDRGDEDDSWEWVLEDLPESLALIGAGAIPALADYLADGSHSVWARVTAVDALERIGLTHPVTRLDCVAAILPVLERYAGQDRTLNSEMIATLAMLKAVEAAGLVQRVYQAGAVDESILGDWEDFQVDVGLLAERLTPPDNDWRDHFLPEKGEGGETGPISVRKEHRNEKNRDKQQRP